METPELIYDKEFEDSLKGVVEDAYKNLKIQEEKDKRNKPYKLIDGLVIKKELRIFKVEIPLPTGTAFFSFSEITRSRQSFETVIRIQINEAVGGLLPYFEQRLDLNSASAISALATALNGAFGSKKETGYNWILMLNKAGGAIKKLINDSRKPTGFDPTKQEYNHDTYLIEPFLEEGVSNMVHGDGDTGKSYFCLYMVVMAVLGRDFLSCPTRTIKTLYLDWEDTETNFNNRIHRIVNGLSELDPSITYERVRKEIHHYKPQGGINEEEEILSSFVEEFGYNLIIIDAGGDASGGSPLDEQAVLRMFNSIERINCTKLLIHHEPKNTTGLASDKTYYGTTYWRARNRVVWRLTTENIDNQNIKTIKAENTKINGRPKQAPIKYTMQWKEQPERTFEIGRSENISEEDYKEGLDQKTQVLSILKEGSLSLPTMVSNTGLKRSSIQRILEGLESSKKVNKKWEGKGYIYSLKNNTTPDEGL